MAFLDGLPPLIVLLVVGVLVVAEVAIVAGVVLPSATALITLGLLANAGTVPITAALPLAAGAALLGGTIAFHAGRRSSRRPRGPGTRHWQRAETLLQRYGGKALFLGQWIVGARTLVPRLAGRNGVPYARFTLWHTPAAMLWAGWMVGASYLAGASYDLVVARAGRATGALVAVAALVAALVPAGRRLARLSATGRPGQRVSIIAGFGRRPGSPSAEHRKPSRTRPADNVRLRGLVGGLGVSVAVLAVLGGLLVLVMPIVVRFSGLAEADVAVAAWARGGWTSDGYLFALDAARLADPGVLLAVAAGVSLARWWWRRPPGGVLAALGPVLPVFLLATVLAVTTERNWQAPGAVVFPAATEFDGRIPFDAAGLVAARAAGHTAQLVAAVGLLAWLLAAWGPRWWRAAVWAAAGSYAAVCAGCWVYLGWSRLSETVAAVLIGAAWAVLNVAIWSAPAEAPPGVRLIRLIGHFRPLAAARGSRPEVRPLVAV
jgi:membrane protein DedA with SNARE-associated domain